MASPPRKQSIQWSPPPGDTANQRERRASSARPYRDAPTPHPKKLSDATSYFDGVRDSAGPSPSGRPPTPGPSLRGRPPTPGPRAIPSEPPKTATPEHPRPSGLLRRSSTMDSEVRERHAVEREQVKAGRAALLRRSSSVDSVPRGTETSAPARSFSTLEEGGQRREHRRRSSVVGSIIRFGMNHGVGHGLPTGKLHMHVPELKVASTATLYERDDRESGEASGVGGGYQQLVKMLRERRTSQIVHHVEGR